ncbi:MAG: hypothetical protein H7176_02090 [Bdellovibrionales bacterium]|nr:hypothetical protein [Massilia sp.]
MTLRESRLPTHIDEKSSGVAGDLAFPVFEGSTLTGFVIMGAKPQCQGYRPDEQMVLESATSLIALHLRTLEAARVARKLSQLEENRALVLQRQGLLEQQVLQLLKDRSAMLQRHEFLEEQMAGLHQTLTKAFHVPTRFDSH